MIRRFTGFDMMGLTIAFFAVVVSVNMVMATLATRTFGGTVVENSYVASQKFNHWLDKARVQSALGWHVEADRGGGRVRLMIVGVDQARVDAVAIHPLGRLPAMHLHFERTAPREYRSRETLPAGRWRLEVRLRRGSEVKDFVEELPA